MCSKKLDVRRREGLCHKVRDVHRRGHWTHNDLRKLDPLLNPQQTGMYVPNLALCPAFAS